MNCAINNSGLDPLQLLRQLGLQPGAFQQQIGQAAPQPRLLQQLLDQFMRAGGGAPAFGDAPIPPQGLVAPPNPGRCGCRGYAPSADTIDLGKGGNKRDASMIEQLLQIPAVRTQVEAALGGKILDDGLADGVLRVQRQPMGGAPAGTNPIPFGPALQGMNMLDGINRGAMQAVGPQAAGADPFMGMMLGALANALGGGGGGGFPIGGGVPIGGGIPIGGGAPVGGGVPIGGGVPMGGGIPIGGGIPMGGGGPVGGNDPFGLGGGNDLGNIMGDPGLTMEDKVVMLLMKLTKSFDRQIEAQANRLQALQNQQGAGGKGAGGKGGGAGGQPSIDVESMNLKRLIDKRSQMFDMLRQVIDKYNQTAKGMIDGLGR